MQHGIIGSQTILIPTLSNMMENPVFILLLKKEQYISGTRTIVMT